MSAFSDCVGRGYANETCSCWRHNRYNGRPWRSGYRWNHLGRHGISAIDQAIHLIEQR
ncbi:hypothetical protein H9626_10915 [Phocaeicola sp. Sa1YUN3]|uniref:Transposase n=1 Tax=Phocaeicola faecium TaxID=2762213 RepID=A0ABR8VD75_9BACT|nr:hypothetical protein [Phocaeicola faecium]